MTRWAFGTLAFLVSFDLPACPLCLGSFQPTAAQQLVDVPHAVLAVPTADASRFRVVEVIKGEQPSSGTIEGAYPRSASDAAPKRGKPLLLVRDDSWPMWTIVGTVGADHSGWLRKLAAGKRSAEMSAEEWRARVALVLPQLENPEPLVSGIAYGELASAPYAALRTAKPRLDAPAVRRWLVDPKLAAREPLYLLLLGFAGDAQDAAALEQRLEAAWKLGDATNLGSLLAADLELRGAARMAWVDAKYLRDRGRSPAEIKAALLALSVQGNVNGTIPRERVIQSYRVFIKEHKDIAGYVAQDLAAWQYWDAVPEYVALMKSDLRQQYPSRLAIIEYLRQSPRAEARGIELKTLVEPGPRR